MPFSSFGIFPWCMKYKTENNFIKCIKYYSRNVVITDAVCQIFLVSPFQAHGRNALTGGLMIRWVYVTRLKQWIDSSSMMWQSQAETLTYWCNLLSVVIIRNTESSSCFISLNTSKTTRNKVSLYQPDCHVRVVKNKLVFLQAVMYAGSSFFNIT